MPPELIAAILGPLVGATFGITGFMSRRSMSVADKQLDEIKESIELVSHQVTSIQIQLPSNYVTKEELSLHINKEDSWHNKMLQEIRELREDVIVLRINHHG